MAFIVDGASYTYSEFIEYLESEFNLEYLAYEFASINNPRIPVNGFRLDGGDVLRGAVAVGAVTRDQVVRDFLNIYLRIVRNGGTDMDLPYDLDGLDVRYVPDVGSASLRSAMGSAHGRTGTAVQKGTQKTKPKAPAKKPAAKSASCRSSASKPKGARR